MYTLEVQLGAWLRVYTPEVQLGVWLRLYTPEIQLGAWLRAYTTSKGDAVDLRRMQVNWKQVTIYSFLRCHLQFLTGVAFQEHGRCGISAASGAQQVGWLSFI